MSIPIVYILTAIFTAILLYSFITIINTISDIKVSVYKNDFYLILYYIIAIMLYFLTIFISVFVARIFAQTLRTTQCISCTIYCISFLIIYMYLLYLCNNSINGIFCVK
jgi:hypothetical protein